jgi:hypothetical protein
MRVFLTVLPLALAASPALAQTATAAAPAPAASAQRGEMAIPPEMSDPRTTDRLVDAMKVLSKAFLELPIGEVEAALNGRPATAADRGRTVRSETQMSERQLQQQIEQARPMMQASMRALMSALPAIMKGMSAAAGEMEKATANLPQPGYPKR